MGTLAALGVAYAVYSVTVGLLTDFPQLEQELTQPLSTVDADSLERPSVRDWEVAAVRGFGPGCKEISSVIQLESRKREDRALPPGRGIGVYVFADTYELPADNPRQVVLRPFSLVNIVRSKDDLADHDEIISMHGEQAVLEFDRPIDRYRWTGMNPVAGWVEKGVVLKTNRKTTDPKDDIVVFTERLHYDRGRNLIWADNEIKIVVESQGTVTATGLEVELQPPDPAAAAKPKSAAKLAKLLRDVRFNLLVGDGEKFLGSPKSPSTTPTESRTDLVITARGPFVFDLETNTATFQDRVRVLQKHPPAALGAEPTVDQLESDALTLRFERASAPPKDTTPKDTAQEGSLRIRQAIATGEEVILVSDSQSLQATGNYLEYDAASRRVVLRGEQEMIAVLSNAVIHARSLVVDHDETDDVRQMVADGPNGWMELASEARGNPAASEPTTPEVSPKLTVRWQGRLQLNKLPDSEQQLVHITGSVELDHDKGALKSDQLKVYLVPIQKADVAANGRSGRRFEPIKLEAEGNVSADAAAYAVVTETLLLDILHPRQELKAPPVNDATAAAAPVEKPAIAEAPPQPSPVAQEASPPAESTENPLVIHALRVSIVVEKLGSQSRPVSAWAEGKVRVTQSPKDPLDRPLQIQGEQMEYKRKVAGDVIAVSGSEGNRACIQSTDMYLEGRHRIVMDEGANRVDVGGPGILRLEARNTLTGRKTVDKEPVHIDWNKSMTFDGKIAFFEGDVKARQTDAEVRCQSLQATFDKRMDFRQSKEGRASDKSKDKAVIEYADCDVDVQVLDRVIEDGKVKQQMRITAPELRFDNIEGTVSVSGPGNVTIVEPSGSNAESANGPPLPFQVSMIDFAERMLGNRNNKVVKFYGGVHIVHSPVRDPAEPIHEDKLHEAGFIVNSGRAEMGESQSPQGQRYRLFTAQENVKVQAQGYWATCARLSYDQQKETLTFAAEQDRFAYFHRQLRPGQSPETFSARQIVYDRRSQEIRTDGSQGSTSVILGGAKGKPAPR